MGDPRHKPGRVLLELPSEAFGRQRRVLLFGLPRRRRAPNRSGGSRLRPRIRGRSLRIDYVAVLVNCYSVLAEGLPDVLEGALRLPNPALPARLTGLLPFPILGLLNLFGFLGLRRLFELLRLLGFLRFCKFVVVGYIVCGYDSSPPSAQRRRLRPRELSR